MGRTPIADRKRPQFSKVFGPMSTTTFNPSEAAIARPSSRAAWLGFAVVVAASVMDLLDSTIAQTAAPAIRRDLGGSFAALEWISAAYTLAMAVTLLLGS